MKVTLLETFLAIVETGNLVRASERLNVTQSTVTARLQSIEEELGQTLLHRQKAGVQLTAAGAKFKRYAEAMTQLWRQARQETALPAGIEAVFNLGCDIDLWPDLGGRLINLIHREKATTALSAWPAGQEELQQWLISGLIDAAITYRPSTREGQTAHPLVTEDLVLASTRPDSPLRFDPGYVYVDLGAEYGRRHAETYADAGVAKIHFGSAIWARDFILENGGTAYLPARLAAPFLESGRLFLIEGAPLFSRAAYFIANDSAAANWPWLPAFLKRLPEELGLAGKAPA
jgi:DNA-binding transcriptional LysR family regulator